MDRAPLLPRAAVLTAAALVVAGCAYLAPREEVPYTGRQRLPLRYSEQEMAVLGAEAYEETSSKYEVVSSGSAAARVTRVGRRIATASRKDYAWKFRLYDDDDVVNAFCLPGGKVGVFSGLLEDIVQTDADMAVVLSHEVAHAVLQHSNERLSQPLAKQLVGLPTSLAVGIWGAISPATRKIVMNGLGAGYLVGELLPYSQQHETEADEVGLLFMRRAGYDLDAAPRLWRRMAEASRGRITDSVSTHPGARERADDLERMIRAMR